MWNEIMNDGGSKGADRNPFWDALSAFLFVRWWRPRNISVMMTGNQPRFELGMFCWSLISPNKLCYRKQGLNCISVTNTLALPTVEQNTAFRPSRRRYTKYHRLVCHKYDCFVKISPFRIVKQYLVYKYLPWVHKVRDMIVETKVIYQHLKL
jgi:hypothetical protein